MPGVAGVLLSLLAAAAAAVVERPTLHLALDVEPGVVIEQRSLRRVAAEVERLWADVVPVRVTLPGAPEPAVADRRVVVHVTRRLLWTHEQSGLGWIFFDAGVPRDELTVSVEAVTRLLEGGHWEGRPLSALPPAVSERFVERALARAIAHEVGHYLLASTDHDARGLMRATFSADEILDERPALVRLSPAAERRLRSRTGLVARRD